MYFSHSHISKGRTEDRIIGDLNFPKSINAGIPKGMYSGEPGELSFPSVDAMSHMIRRKGSGSYMFK